MFEKKVYGRFWIKRKKLLATENALLVEGNTWNDTYWGVCNGVGKNTLGQLLMKIRRNSKDYLMSDYDSVLSLKEIRLLLT